MEKIQSNTQDEFLAEPAGKKDVTPLRLLLIGILGIFLAEGLVMVLVHTIKPPTFWWDSLIDALVLGLIIFPIFYYFAYKVFPAQVAKRRRTETVLREVLENLPVGVWIIDRNGMIQHGNPAARDIWGGTREVGIEGYGEFKAWWPDDGKPVKVEEWGAVRAIRDGEITLNQEVEIETFNGVRKLILNSAVPFYSDRGVLEGAVVVNQDITQRRRMEKELLQNYELLERYFSSIDTLIAYMGRDFNFIRVNDSYARAAGHSPEFFIGKNHFELYPHEENQAIFQRVVETGEPFVVQEKPFEFPEYPERGVTYWNWALQPVREPGGGIQGLVLSLVDVTERKRAEIQLEEQNKALQKLSDTEHRLRERAEGLAGASMAVSSSLELEEVLNQIMLSLQRSISFRTANILLYEDGAFNLAHHWCSCVTPEHDDRFRQQYPLQRSPFLKQVLQTQQPIVIESTKTHPDYVLVPGMEWVVSYLAAPLMVGGKVIGIIDLSSDRDQEFSREIADQLMPFGASAAVAIQNARLYSAEQHARQVAETLNAASLDLTRTLVLDEVLDTLLDYTQRIVQFDRATVFMLDDELRLSVRAQLVHQPVAGEPPGLAKKFELWDEPLLRSVVNAKSSLVIPDSARLSDWKDEGLWRGVRTWVGIPMVANEKTIGVVALVKMVPDAFSSEHVRLAESIVAQATVAVQNAWLFEQVRAGHDRLQTLYHRLVDIQENERRHIARELHDDTSQALASTMISLRLLEQDSSLTENARARIKKEKEVIDQVLENLHRLAVNLRPAGLDLLGLVATLEQIIKEYNEHYGMNIHFKVIGFTGEARLPGEVEITIYRIVQEALNNVVRHAQTANVDVILKNMDNKVIAMVEDDGIGYDMNTTRAGGHLGLIGMQERTQMAGGVFRIESNPGGGTTVVVEIPYGD